jgi:signal transduction histidine kinase
MNTVTKTVDEQPKARKFSVMALPLEASLLLRRYKTKLAHTQLLHNPQPLLTIMLVGTFLFVSLLLAMLLVGYFILGNTFLLERTILCASVFIYLFFAAVLLQNRHYQAVGWMLIAMYVLLGFVILFFWGINAPVGILVLGFTIILAGVLGGTRYIIPVASAMVALLAVLHVGSANGWVHPDRTPLDDASTWGDVISYGIIFLIFALVSWLSRRQMEQSLQRALQAEALLEKEKDMLAVRLEEQTRHLREVQFDEMRQLYRFAELGQLSTALLHELANHLTVLTLDIDDLHQRHSRSRAIAHAKESISHLDAMVDQVRQQLRETNLVKEIPIPSLVNETLATIESKAKTAGVSLEYEAPVSQKNLFVFGDPLRLSQILTVLVTNAVEAYQAIKKEGAERRVVIKTVKRKSNIEISVSDWGSGIPEKERKRLFLPFRSTKEDGMGVGLFIAKEMIETHFKGTIMLDKPTSRTTFVIQIPAVAK